MFLWNILLQVAGLLMLFTTFGCSWSLSTKCLKLYLILSVILLICWTEASAVSAPPQTLQEKWKECRPPLLATPLLLVYRTYRQNEHRERD